MSATAVDATPAAGAREFSLYRWVWRWHLYAGLWVAPFVLMLAVTGGLYLFADDIEAALYPELALVSPVDQGTAASIQEAAILSAYPGANIERMRWPMSANHAAQWQIRNAPSNGGLNSRLTVFVDPSDAQVLGALPSESRLGEVLGNLHGELMLGRLGDTLVELAASWAFILLVTGTYLWWPRPNRNVGTWTPQLRRRTGRAWWRELHAVPATWNGFIVAFLILSGLPWAGFWGEQLARLGTIDASLKSTPNFLAPPRLDKSKRVNIDVHHGQADLPWAVRMAGAPSLSGVDARPEVNQHISIDAVIAEATARGIAAPGLRVIYPQNLEQTFTLSFVPDTAQRQRTVHLDPRDGRIIEDVGWPQYSALGRSVELGVMTHLGRQFGEFNRWLMAISCLLILLTVCSGVGMWWQRRNTPATQTLKVPRRVPILVVTIAVVLGLLFPLAGLSMLSFAAIDLMLSVRRARAGLLASNSQSKLT